jgi:dihydrofolate reductase
MRKLILSMMTSLDGHIARRDGSLDWFLTDAQLEEEMLGLLRSVDAMLFGRVAYELLAQFWPTAGTPGSEEAPGGFTSRAREIEFAHLMNSIPKVVYSRSLDAASWGPATVVRTIEPDEIERQKRQPGRDLVLFAGSSIARSFAKLDLIDEYRLMVHPIVLGKGLSLFDGLDTELALELRRTTTFRSGLVLLQFQRARAGRT